MVERMTNEEWERMAKKQLGVKPNELMPGADGGRNCGECLMERVQVVALDERGVCPKCGTDYGPPK